MTRTKLTVTTPLGTLERTTHRTYTHVVVLEQPYHPRLRALAWCGSAKLAEGQLRYWTANKFERLGWRFDLKGPYWVRTYPVDGSGAYTVGPIHQSPIVVELDETQAFIEDDGGPLVGLPELIEPLAWDDLAIERRRELLRAADLWDGNTYAARAWAELPVHIRGDIERAHAGQEVQ